MRKHRSKRLTALVLALVLCLSLVVPVGAVGTSGGTNVRFEQVDNSVVSARSVLPSLTRARASSMLTKSSVARSARPARRSKEVCRNDYQTQYQ